MTASEQKGVYVVSAQKRKESAKAAVSGHRIAQAVRNTAAYRKKK